MCTPPLPTVAAWLAIVLPLSVAAAETWRYRRGLPGVSRKRLMEVTAELDVLSGAPRGDRVRLSEDVSLDERMAALEDFVDQLDTDLKRERQGRERMNKFILEKTRRHYEELQTRLIRHEGGHVTEERQEERFGVAVGLVSLVAGFSAVTALVC